VIASPIFSKKENERKCQNARCYRNLLGSDEATYRKALSIFTDPENMPASFNDWKALVGRECELIKGSGNIAIRADIDPETFTAWCASRGL